MSYFLAASLRCQASSAAGVTRKTSAQRPRGTSRASAANPARSPGSASGLLGKDYGKDTEAESGHHLHIRAAKGRLWRISLEAVDAWTLPASAGDTDDDKGPFARLLSSP